VAVIPVLVRMRAVALLVGDCGEAGIDRGSLREVVDFCGVVRKAFERIILRRKLDGIIAGKRTSGQSRTVDHPSPAATNEEQPVSAEASPPQPEQTSPPQEPAVSVPQPPPRSAPPAANIAAVRTIGGPPIPREEPDWPDTGSDARSTAVPGDGVPAHTAGPRELDSLSLGEPEGESSVDALMARFPGRVSVPRAQIAVMTLPPAPSECGPVLRELARHRRDALPHVLARLTDGDAEVRGWATYLLCEMPAIDAIPPLLERCQDDDPSTRAAARYAMAAVGRAFGKDVVDALVRLAVAADARERSVAIRELGQAGQAATVPELIKALSNPREPEVVSAAHVALARVTRQDFGTDVERWSEWWQDNAARHRIEWLIDALVSDSPDVRRVAGEELRVLSREYFGYSSDLPPRDRERAQQRYRDWWVTQGRALHAPS
jgi:hypothetical protein